MPRFAYVSPSVGQALMPLSTRRNTASHPGFCSIAYLSGRVYRPRIRIPNDIEEIRRLQPDLAVRTAGNRLPVIGVVINTGNLRRSYDPDRA